MPEKAQNGERLKGIGDFFKKKKDDKKFFLKVGIAVGVVLLLIVVIIVVAAVVPKGGDDGGDSGAVQNNVQTSTTKAPERINLEFVIPAYYMVQLGTSMTSMLAVDDVTQSYIIQVDEVFRTIYVLVKFKERSQIYIGIQKEANRAKTDVQENTVLFCFSRGFDSNFDGQYLDSESFKRNGQTQYGSVSGTNVTITVSPVDGPLKLTGPVARVFNSSCDDLRPQDVFQWGEKETACEGNQTVQLDPNDEPPCQTSRCPNYDQSQPLTTKQACKKFRSCNSIMGKCDRVWTRQNPYNGQPYCNCRRLLAEDASTVMCPKASIDQAECESPRRRAEDMSNQSPCLCQYRIRRIHPFLRRSRDSGWQLDTLSVTGPAPRIEHCPCSI
ncbi:uncharacterized protein [Haliotis cracherodii]|uniref:uncharacterized protein n=1 Tax=Haliotis cracherodii TaxID=6455 RepID=UPI0039EBDEC8